MTIALGMPGRRAADAPAALAARVSDRPDASGLVDRHGRTATDLRVSLTDRCNLRCTYCMPAEGLPFLPRDAVLSREEIVRLVGIGTRELGIRQVRFTGGEPLLRADLVDIVRGCAALPERPELSLTTNGIGLAERATALRDAGLDRVNVSLDSIHPDVFATISRRAFLDRVLEGIDALVAAGFDGTKINAVLMPGLNDAEAPGLVDWALQGGHQLRFIEQMPLDADHRWDRATMITAHQIRELLSERFELAPDPTPRDGAPAELYRVSRRGEPGIAGTIGIIASVTEPFCEDCRRSRITAEGAVRSCLFSHEEFDLRGALRSGASDDDIAQLWRYAMWLKPAGHGLDADGFTQPARTMSAIGG